MKATVEIDDNLYRELKATAARNGRKVKDLIAEGVLLVLRQAPAPAPESTTSLPLIECGPPGTLEIPDDVAYVIDGRDDRLDHAAPRRQ